MFARTTRARAVPPAHEHARKYLSDVLKVLVDATRVTVMLMFIIANALLFAHVLTTERIPQIIAEQIL